MHLTSSQALPGNPPSEALPPVKENYYSWVDYESYCALFFAEAIATTFSNVYIYIEFPEMLELGYRTV